MAVSLVSPNKDETILEQKLNTFVVHSNITKKDVNEIAKVILSSAFSDADFAQVRPKLLKITRSELIRYTQDQNCTDSKKLKKVIERFNIALAKPNPILEMPEAWELISRHADSPTAFNITRLNKKNLPIRDKLLLKKLANKSHGLCLEEIEKIIKKFPHIKAQVTRLSVCDFEGHEKPEKILHEIEKKFPNLTELSYELRIFFNFMITYKPKHESYKIVLDSHVFPSLKRLNLKGGFDLYINDLPPKLKYMTLQGRLFREYGVLELHAFPADKKLKKVVIKNDVRITFNPQKIAKKVIHS